MKKVIHLIDSLSRINYGIWHAALVNCELYQRDNIEVECWSVEGDKTPEEFHGVRWVKFSSPILQGKKRIKELKRSNEEVVFVSHGTWRFPTKLGQYAVKNGFRWVSVPHGMLEPWSMHHHWWKKIPYFHLIEKNVLKQATAIRAVAPLEAEHLKQWFGSVDYVPNPIHPCTLEINKEDGLKVVFLGRLHSKKNPFELVSAWRNSKLANREKCVLQMVGPDEGETEKIKNYIDNNSITNIELVGPVYGVEKTNLLIKAHAFFLPSQSEGFPTTVLEAMSHELVPFISTECNMDFLKTDGVCYHSGKSVSEITEALDMLCQMYLDNQLDGATAKKYADEKYSVTKIYNQEKDLYFGTR